MSENEHELIVTKLESALEQEQYARAAELAHELLAVQVSCDAAYNALAMVALETDDTAKALMYYELALLENPTSETLNYNIGMLYDQFLGDYKTAMTYYEQALELNPEYVEVYLELIEIRLENNLDLEQARREVELALALAPKNARLLNDSGCLYIRHEHQVEAAIEQFKQAVLLADNKALVAANLADAYMKAKQYEQAKQAYELSLGHDPTNPLICHNYAHLLQHKLHEFERAKQLYERAIALAPHEVHPYVGLKALYVNHLKQPLEAAKRLEAALEVVRDRTRLEYELAELYDVVLEDFEKAVFYYECVLAVYPNNITILNALAFIHVQVLKKYEEGIQYYERVLAIDDQLPITYVNIGHVYFLKMNLPELALSYYEKAKQLIQATRENPSYQEELYFNLGLLYENHKGELLHAVNYFEQAMTIKGSVYIEKHLLKLYGRISRPFHAQGIS